MSTDTVSSSELSVVEKSSAPVNAIRAEAQWAAKALVNAEVEGTGKFIDSRERGLIETNTAQLLENTSLEIGLDLKEINEQIFKARTGRGLMDDVEEKVNLKAIRLRVDQSIVNDSRATALGLQQAQQAFSNEEYIDHEASYIADLMLEKKGVVPQHQESIDVLKDSLVAAANYAELNLPELAEKLELGKALADNTQRKSQELASYGVLRGVPKIEHANHLMDYQIAYDQKLSHASYIAHSVIEKDSPDLKGSSRNEAEAALTNRLLRADIKGELKIETMRDDISLEKAGLSDEINF